MSVTDREPPAEWRFSKRSWQRQIRRKKALAFEAGLIWGAAIIAWADAIRGREPAAWDPLCCIHGMFHREHCEACEAIENGCPCPGETVAPDCPIHNRRASQHRSKP